MPVRSRLLRVLSLALLLVLAASLRFWGLDRQSLWNDEGTSIALAGRSLEQITLSAAADIHPPFYHYLLHYWLRIFGTSEASARALSALLGVGLVSLLYLLGRRLFDPLTGFLAALLAAVSSYQVYYAQEARMYMLLAMLGAVSVYLFYLGWLAPVRARRGWAMAAWALLMVLTLYTHYLAVGLILAENGAALLALYWTVRSSRPQEAQALLRRLLVWLGLQALVGVAYIPWLRLTWAQLHRWPAVSQPYSLWQLLQQALPLFALGPFVEVQPLIAPAAVILGLAVLGLLLPDQPERSTVIARGLSALCWLTPLAVLYILSRSRPVYHPKFLLLATPGFLLLVARGIARLGPTSSPSPIGGNFRRWRSAYHAGNAGVQVVPLPLPPPQGRSAPLGRGKIQKVWGIVRRLRRRTIPHTEDFTPIPGEEGSRVMAHSPQEQFPLPQGGEGGVRGDRLDRAQACHQVAFWSRVALAVAATLVAIAAALPGLHNYYFDPRYARDDYRGIARYIRAVGQPGDVILVNAPSQVETFGYYYQGPLRVVPIPAERPPNRDRTVSELAEVTAQARHVYGIFWATVESDPERIVEGWLDTHAYKALDAWYGNVRLLVYALPAQGSSNVRQHSLEATLGEHIILEGYSLTADPVTAGDIVQLTLYWRATGQIEHRYKVFTHLLDADGIVVGQRDAEPGGGVLWTSSWQEGERIVDHYGLPILPGTAPGEYQIEVGMYGLEDGQRLPVNVAGRPVGDRILLQTVQVQRPEASPPAAALDMQVQRPLQGGDLQLLGYSIGRAGALDQGQVPLAPGETAELVLFWQATSSTAASQPVVSLRLRDSRRNVRLELARAPVNGRYPVREWQPGEIVRDPLRFVLPDDLDPGSYQINIEWPGLEATSLLTLRVR